MARLDKLFESEKVEWETPEDLFDQFDEEFHFTLDVAASAENTKCPSYFSLDDDGLAQDWVGVCWCNPPYGRGMVKWLVKAAQETWRGTTTVCLIPARTNTNWFHNICLTYGTVRFLRGRPKFVGNKHGLPWPLCVVVFHGKPQLSHN